MQKCLKIHQLDIIIIIEKDCENKLMKDIKVFLKKTEKKSNNMVVNDRKV